jgi:hypothetical protein
MGAQDRLEVMELIGRYQHVVDGGDPDAYASNFIPEGVVEWSNGIRQGRAEIREWMAGLIANGGLGAHPARMRHFISMPYILRGDAERCCARTYMVIFALDERGEIAAYTHWTYIDDIVKREGEWLFEKRYMQQDMRGSGPRLGSAVAAP